MNELTTHFRDTVRSFLDRTGTAPARLGIDALGDPSFVHRLMRGREPRLDTADKVLAFMGEAPVGPAFRAEVDGFVAVTRTKPYVLGLGREARRTIAREETREGRAGLAAETDKPFEQHATENVPVIGEWFAGKLFGTARNEAPDGAEDTTPAGADGGTATGEEDRPRASRADRKRWRHGR